MSKLFNADDDNELYDDIDELSPDSLFDAIPDRYDPAADDTDDTRDTGTPYDLSTVDPDPDADDIDTGTRYDPAAPIPLTSCYHCNPTRWKAGARAKQPYYCIGCHTSVECICMVVTDDD